MAAGHSFLHLFRSNRLASSHFYQRCLEPLVRGIHYALSSGRCGSASSHFQRGSTPTDSTVHGQASVLIHDEASRTCIETVKESSFCVTECSLLIEDIIDSGAITLPSNWRWLSRSSPTQHSLQCVLSNTRTVAMLVKYYDIYLLLSLHAVARLDRQP